MDVIAMDVDGTIAAGGQWFVRLLASEFHLPIADEVLAALQYSAPFWALPEVRALSQEQRRAMREVARTYQHDPEAQRNTVPLPGAVQALQALTQHGKIIYTTCRHMESQALTQEWLEQHGFPDPANVFCCEHYPWKYKHAASIANKRQRILFFDDQADVLVKSFRPFGQMDGKTALSLVTRMAIIAFGKTEPPSFPVNIPFQILALPSWQPKDLAEVESRVFQNGDLPISS
jgi:uncharacterized HAD superfamily protein